MEVGNDPSIPDAPKIAALAACDSHSWHNFGDEMKSIGSSSRHDAEGRFAVGQWIGHRCHFGGVTVVHQVVVGGVVRMREGGGSDLAHSGGRFAQFGDGVKTGHRMLPAGRHNVRILDGFGERRKVEGLGDFAVLGDDGAGSSGDSHGRFLQLLEFGLNGAVGIRWRERWRWS